MLRVCPALLIAALAVATSPGPAAGADGDSRTIAPFVDGDVVAVARFDLDRLRVGELLSRVLPDKDEASEMAGGLVPWISALHKAGARELFLVVDPADLPAHPVVVVPLKEGIDARPIGRLLCGEEKEKPPLHWPTCATIHQAVFAGTPEALERIKRLKPVARPELDAAFAASSGRAVQFLLIPTNDNRRVFREMVPTMPKELGGGTPTPLTDGFAWASFGLESMPRPGAKVVIQSKDDASARALGRIFGDGLRWFEGLAWTKKRFPDFSRIVAQIKPAIEQDRVVLDINLEQGSAIVESVQRAYHEQFGRVRCVQNLLQIGLAMHNYHATYRRFPPAYTVDAQGKPLLSWRVLLLPYLEQDSLYKEFHLDEAWDSPHNRPLASRMPAVYRCPGMSRRLNANEMTTYVVPRGEGTIFPGTKEVDIKAITDGTSNTILTIDAGDAHATTWTKPQDWDADAAKEFGSLFGHHPEGTNFGYADGSVRFQKETINPNTLKAFLTRNGGEVIGSND
ncbi:DUF1559 domain-containing protein [Singulisphaera sp. PoT]|uniref:DUF1559 family PulG-like putative transporter n=1 Tax=Singulisphaera sp. PoT TaxID=3411797 RepID=UPI003BF4A6F4